MSQTKLSFWEEFDLCSDYINQMPIRKIMEKYNICMATIRCIRVKYGIPKRPRILIPINENYFEQINTKNKAYHLGFIMGDGTVATARFDRLKIKIKSDDTNILKNFIIDTQSMHSIKKETTYLKTTGKFYELCVLTINRRKLCDDLIKLGVGPNKSKELCLPKIPQLYKKHMIRGIIDSDGSFNVSKEGRISFNIQSSTKELLIDVGEIFIENCGIKSINIYSGHGNCWALQYGGADDVKNIASYVYNDGGIWLNRKYKVCEDFYGIDNFNYKSENFI